ncbi:MAG: dienelactone hydrolase family protein [Nannocystaceae bacterium]|nr:dienelactone hydrolase family protein [Nannocystaceae bacterium]
MRRFVVLVALSWACSEPYAARPGTPPPAATATAVPQAGGAAVPPTSEPAPAPTPEAAGPRAGEIHYVERVLGGAGAQDTLPMVVAIHGLGDDPRNFGLLFDGFVEPVRLILPQGLDPRPAGGFSWFPLRARDPDVEALSAGIASAADKLAVAIDELARTRPTAGKPIVTGFSQGGMLSFAIAVRHPDSVALAVPLGGWLPPPLWPHAHAAKGVPRIVALHGSDDGAVKLAPTEAAVEALHKHGWPAELHVYPGVGHIITPEIHRDLDDLLIDAARSAAKSKPRTAKPQP